VDRLRAERGDAAGERRDARTLVLAAADPANPYGTVLSWPRRDDDDRRSLSRTAGAYVVLDDGEPVLYLDRGGHSLQTLPAAASPAALDAAVRAMAAAVTEGRLAPVQIERVDGAPIADPRLTEALATAGFHQGYRGWALRLARS
jgi:ATP-dependent Lhr-like helicase